MGWQLWTVVIVLGLEGLLAVGRVGRDTEYQTPRRAICQLVEVWALIVLIIWSVS